MAKITETELLKRGFVYNDSLDSYYLPYMDVDNGAGDRITVKKKRSTKKWEATFYRRDLQTHNEEVGSTQDIKRVIKNYEFQYRDVRRVVTVPFLLWLGFEANPPKLEWKGNFGVYLCTLEEFGVEVIKDFQIRTFYDLKHFFSSAHLFDIFKTMK